MRRIIAGIILFACVVIAIHQATKTFVETDAGAKAKATAAAEPESCDAASFSVDKLHGTTERGYLRVTGIVHNDCDEPMGVQLKWTGYFADGSIAFSENFWPASTTNIHARSGYPFEAIHRAPEGESRYRIEPIRARSW
jgi:hypothetical protein